MTVATLIRPNQWVLGWSRGDAQTAVDAIVKQAWALLSCGYGA